MAHLALYTRISQDKTGAGMSVDNQLNAITEWATEHGHTLGEHFSDNDISAYNGKRRPEFERMLTVRPNAVVCWHQDRLLRVSRDLELVLETEMTVHQVVAGSLDLATPQGKAVARTVAAWSTYEIEQKGARQKLRSSSDAKAGRWHYSRPVFGNDRVTGELIPDEAEAIRNAAQRIASEEASFFKIAKEWNAAGFRTPQSKGAGGRLWEPGTVRNFFTAPRLIGKRAYEGQTFEMKGWEPVLDEATFNTIQDLIDAKRTGKPGVQGSRNMPHLLTGIATCAECHKGLNVRYRGGAGSARAYKCTTPGHVSRVADPLEKWVVEKFLYLLMHDGAAEVVSPNTAATGTKLRQERIRGVKAHEVWIKEATEPEPVAGEASLIVSPRVIALREAAHAKWLTEIDAKLLDVMRETSFADLLPEMVVDINAMWKRWDSVPIERKRAVVRSLFKKIEVQKASQGQRFQPRYVQLEATDLMMKLVALNDEVAEPATAEARWELKRQSELELDRQTIIK